MAEGGDRRAAEAQAAVEALVRGVRGRGVPVCAVTAHARAIVLAIAGGAVCEVWPPEVPCSGGRIVERIVRRYRGPLVRGAPPAEIVWITERELAWWEFLRWSRGACWVATRVDPPAGPDDATILWRGHAAPGLRPPAAGDTERVDRGA